MKNDWYKILGLENNQDFNNINIRVLLDEFFKKFIFKDRDKDGNIIVLYTKDKEEYKVEYNKKCESDFEGKYFLNNILLILNVEKESEYEYINKKLDVKIHTSFDGKEYGYYIDLVEEKRNSNDLNASQYVSNLNYCSKSFHELFEEASVSTKFFYADCSSIMTRYLLPDTSCLTRIFKNINDDNDDNILNNFLYIQGMPISDKEKVFKSNLPITYLLINEHKDFFNKHYYKDGDLKNNHTKTYKIGF